MSNSYFRNRVKMEIDGITTLGEMFRQDSTPGRMNLVPGVIVDEEGIVPVLNCVRKAAIALVKSERDKPQLPAIGDADFRMAAEKLVFGEGSELLSGRRVRSLQTTGSTAALRMAAELVHSHNQTATVWISRPAYSNHIPIMEDARLQCAFHRYADPVTGRLQFDEMLEDLQEARPGDVVLLHASSHNPAAVDPSPAQWEGIAQFMRERALLPLIDNAYQGLGADIDEDAIGLRTVTSVCPESFVTTSFSKSVMMYAERVGMLSIVTESPGTTQYVCDHARAYVRRTYTAPAAFGARVVARVLTEPELRKEWLGELYGLRDLLHQRRAMFADALDAYQIAPEVFPGLRSARGMFAMSRLTPDQVERLRNEHHVYVLDNGRVSIAKMSKALIDPFCERLAAVSR